MSATHKECGEAVASLSLTRPDLHQSQLSRRFLCSRVVIKKKSALPKKMSWWGKEVTGAVKAGLRLTPNSLVAWEQGGGAPLGFLQWHSPLQTSS